MSLPITPRPEIVPIWYWSPNEFQLRVEEEELTEWVRFGAYSKAVNAMVAHLDRLRGDELMAGHERLVRILNYWAMLSLNDVKYIPALDLLKSAEKYINDHLPRSTCKAALRKQTLCNLARYFKRRRKSHAALQYLEHALRIERVYEDEVDPLLHLNYGVLLGRKYESGRMHFEKSITASRLAYEDGQVDALVPLIVAYFNAGAVQLLLKQQDEARGNFQQASHLLQDLDVSAPLPPTLGKKIEYLLQQLPPPRVTISEAPLESTQSDVVDHELKSIYLPQINSPPRRFPHPTTPRMVFHKYASRTADTFCRSTTSFPSNCTTVTPRKKCARVPLKPVIREINRISAITQPIVSHESVEKDGDVPLPIVEPSTKDSSVEEYALAEDCTPVRIGEPIGPPTPTRFSPDMDRLQAISMIRMRKTMPSRKEHVIRNQAAVRLQALWRGWIVRRYSARELAHRAAMLDDNKRKSAYRVVYAARRAFVEYGAAVKIQSCVRGHFFRRMVKEEVKYVAWETAMFLQSYVRMFIQRRRYIKMRNAAISIQGLVRQAQHKRIYRDRKAGIARITAAARGYVVRSNQERVRIAQTTIGRAQKGYAQRMKLAAAHCAALSIQKMYRGTRERARLRHLHKMQIRLAKCVRGRCARLDYTFARETCVQIQAWWRGGQVRRRLKKFCRMLLYFRRILQRGMKWSARTTRLQAAFRGMQCREVIRRWIASSLRIQAWLRGVLCRRHMVLRKASAICIQSSIRSLLSNKRLWCSAQFAPIKNALKLASYGAGWKRFQSAAIAVQRGWRARGNARSLDREQWREHCAIMLAERQHYVALKRKTITLQAAWRGHSARASARQRAHASVVLQRQFREWRVNRSAHLAAVRVQRCWRGYSVRASYAGETHRVVAIRELNDILGTLGIPK